MEILREISTEQKFDATYVDIEEKSHSSKDDDSVFFFLHWFAFP